MDKLYDSMPCLTKTKELRFEVTGTIAVPKEATLLYDAWGGIRGYEIQGREVSLVLGLEVTTDGIKYEYLTGDGEMGQQVGSQVLNYDVTSLSEEDN